MKVPKCTKEDFIFSWLIGQVHINYAKKVYDDTNKEIAKYRKNVEKRRREYDNR